MKWYAKHTEIQPPTDGAVRLYNRFAWQPVTITGLRLWLCWYEILQVYRISEQKVTIDGKEVVFLPGQWVNITKRCK